jgi:hypothetical protein
MKEYTPPTIEQDIAQNKPERRVPRGMKGKRDRLVKIIVEKLRERGGGMHIDVGEPLTHKETHDLSLEYIISTRGKTHLYILQNSGSPSQHLYYATF